MATLTIQAISEIREVEPDGCKCFHCQDQIFLKQYRWFLVFESGGEMPIEGLNFCQSCVEAHKE